MLTGTSQFLLIIIAALTSIIGNSLFRMGLQKTGIESLHPAYLFKNFFSILFQPFVLGGFLMFVIGMVIWMRVLTIVPLSKSYPIFISFVILFITISSVIFLKEPLSLVRVVGMALIVVGAFLVFAK